MRVCTFLVNDLGEKMGTEETSVSNTLSTFIIENFEIAKTPKGYLKIGTSLFYGAGKVKKFVDIIISSNRGALLKIVPDLVVLSDKDLYKEMSNYYVDIESAVLAHINKIEVAGVNEDVDLVLNSEEYKQFVPVVDVEDPEGGSRMVDKITGELFNVTHKAWLNIVGKNHASLVNQPQPRSGRFIYNPYSSKSNYVRETRGITETVYNSYIIPDVKRNRNLDAVLDERYIKFLKTFFLNEDSLNYALNWMYHTCFKRSPVYLVLVGSGAIGKNFLVDSLAKIHGQTNVNKASITCLDATFQNHLLECTLLYYDECEFGSGKKGETRKNKLKDWANSIVRVNQKHMKSADLEIFGSAIMATNNDSDVGLVQRDRKFAPLELTDDKMEKRLGKDCTDFLWSYMQEDTDFPHALLNWLETVIDPNFDVQAPYKGPKFHQLVATSLTEWQSSLVTELTGGDVERISFKNWKEERYMASNIRNVKVDNFLRDYEHEGHRLGFLKKIEGQYYIMPNPAFLNEDEELIDIDPLSAL